MDLLIEMNFLAHWVELIMQCVTTIFFQVQVNGELCPRFQSHTRLCQDDPISLYLFILCMSILSGHLTKSQDDGNFKGIKVSRNAPSINHLIYADDILLFFKANSDSIDHVKRIFSRFAEVSSLVINPTKSEITFSPNTPNMHKKIMSVTYKFKKVDKFTKYLSGCVDEASRSRKTFDIIMEKLQDCLQGFYSHVLS